MEFFVDCYGVLLGCHGGAVRIRRGSILLPLFSWGLEQEIWICLPPHPPRECLVRERSVCILYGVGSDRV